MTESTAKLLVRKALDAGYRCACTYGGDIDYMGTDFDKIIETLEACDEMMLRIMKEGSKTEAALIIMGLEPDEQVADYTDGGFIRTALEG